MVPFYVKILVGIVILSAIIYGLTISISREKSKGEVVANYYYELLEKGEFGIMVSLFSADFFKNNYLTPEQWLSLLKENYERLGEMHDFKLIDWTERKETQYGTPAIYYQLNFVCSYANDSTSETFIIQQPLSNKDSLKILNHSITPNRIELKATGM